METKTINTITVNLDYYLALKRDATLLQCLIDTGVDSWDGYESAIEAYREEVVEDDDE